jgi:hypothetical protein
MSAREWIYENVTLPLYNAWRALHWYLAMAGFTYPLADEISPGLMTLGVGVDDVWDAVQSALADPAGGLHAPPSVWDGSGSEGVTNKNYPRDVVVDPATPVARVVDGQWLRHVNCLPPGSIDSYESPSEYLRPWLWPSTDNEGDPVPIEGPITFAGPYTQGHDATVLFGQAPGHATTRGDFEACANELATITLAASRLPLGQHLGDPVDYTAYVIGKLTRDNTVKLPNFNLDADRGYGYLCWDWKRSRPVTAIPYAFQDEEADKRIYHAPIRPGTGWCNQEITEGTNLPSDPAFAPKRHDPTGPADDVGIRYIDHEVKYYG